MSEPSRTLPIDLPTLHAQVEEPYRNERVARVNDHEVRMSVMTQPFGWHVHPDSDETFLVIAGELVISLEDRDIVLGPGQLLTVPSGTRHRTRPNGSRSVNLTFERANAITLFEES